MRLGFDRWDLTLGFDRWDLTLLKIAMRTIDLVSATHLIT
jgi:hypothetical protein